MTTKQELQHSPDGTIPPHKHILEFVFVDYEGSMGDVRCTYAFTIPPGPRSKRPLKRYCDLYLSPEQVLSTLEERVL